jgi:hypothetical protein
MARGIHIDLEPIHIAERGRVVAEGLHASEVRNTLPSAVQQRLVHAEVVGVAVDVNNGPGERD